MRTVRELPSRFIPYPKGAQVGFEFFSFADIEDFNRTKLTLKDYYLFLLEGIKTKGMDKMDLTFEDFMYLSTLRKLESMGDIEYQVSIKCDCEKKPELTKVFSLSDLDYKELDVKKVPVFTKIKSTVCAFSPFTVGGFIECLTDFEESPPSEDADKFRLLKKQVYASMLEGEYKDNIQRFRKLSPKDTAPFMKVEEMFQHGLKPFILECTECKKEIPVILERRDLYIRPFRLTKKTDGVQVFYDKETASASK